jgi:hypothetical protein
MRGFLLMALFIDSRLTPALLALGVLSQLHAYTAAWILPLWASAGIAWSLMSNTPLAIPAQRSLDLAVSTWLALWLLSCLLSLDVAHSFQLSVPTLVFAIGYVLLSREREASAIGSALLWSLATVASWQALLLCASSLDGLSPQARITDLQTPLLLVPNDCLWMICLWPLWWCEVATRGRGTQLAIVAMLALQGVAIISVQSRLSLAIAALIALAATFIYAKRFLPALTPRSVKMVALTAIVACVILGWFALSLFGKGNASLLSRLQLAHAAADLWLQHPWFGLGPHGFALHYREALQGASIDARSTPWPHQLPLELLANTGMFATLSFAWLIWVRLRALLASGGREPLLLCFLAFAVASFFEASTLRVWWWILLVLLISDVRSCASNTKFSR